MKSAKKDAEFLALVIGTANLEAELAPKIEDLKRRKALIIEEVMASRKVDDTATGGRVYKFVGEGPNAGLSMTISWPAPEIKFPKAKLAALQKLCGDKFRKLFFELTINIAVKNFRDVARAVLTPAKAKKAIALCEVASAPRLKFTRQDAAEE